MSDVEAQLARLRRDVDELLARLPAGGPSGAFGEGTSGLVNEAVVRHLKATLEREGKRCGVAISRVVLIYNEGGTACWAGHITMSSAADMPRGTKLRPSVVALATDPLALRAVRMLIEPYFAGKPMRMTKSELAAAMSETEAALEDSLRPLVADGRLDWTKMASGEEAYEIADVEPHLVLLQSLE